MRHACAVLVCAAAAALSSIVAHAGVVYMWIDASGRVQYSDQPPKNFTGPVKRMEMDDSPALPPAPVKPVPAAAPVAALPPANDMNSKRRANRERLTLELQAARDRLGEARKALAEHQEPQDDERHMVQRPGADPKAPGMPGKVRTASRLNCHTQQVEGKKVTTCPVSVPNESYFTRIDKLEEAVKRAEEDLATAERAYRQGVD